MSDLTDAREAHMEHLYGWICRQPDQEAAIAGLEDYALRELGGWLMRRNALHGVPGMIHGLCLVESSNRFMKMKNPPANTGGEA